MTDNTRGALLMMASMAAFTLNDTFMKSLSDEMSLMQALFLRGTMTVLLIAAIAAWQGLFRVRLSRRDWGFVGVRTVAEIGAAYFFLTALFNMPIANVTAILQVVPLAVTLAGAVFLREPVGWRRWLAILVGFAGVMLIVRPGPAGFDFYSVYVLIAVCFVTLRDLSARQLSRGVPSMTVALSAATGVAVFAGLSTLTEPWAPVSGRAGLQLIGATGFVIVGYLCSVMVMRVGDIGMIAPFRYTGLLWALVLGLAVFGEWPSALTLLGSAIVVATGIFTLYRERRMARRAPLPLRIR